METIKDTVFACVMVISAAFVLTCMVHCAEVTTLDGAKATANSVNKAIEKGLLVVPK